MKANIVLITCLLGVCHSIPYHGNSNKKISFREEAMCDATGRSISDLLRHLESDMVQVELFWRLLDGTSLEDVLCDLEGITHLTQMKDTLDTEGVTYNIFRVFYGHITTYIPWFRNFVLNYNAPSSTADIRGAMLDIFSSLESSGILDLDPDGTKWFLDHLEHLGVVSQNWIDTYEPAPQSHDPVTTQCVLVAGHITKLYGVLMAQQPHILENLVNFMSTWIGFDLQDQTVLTKTVCLVMETALNEGFQPLYQLISNDLEVTSNVIQTAYPIIVSVIEKEEDRISWWTDSGYDDTRPGDQVYLDELMTRVFNNLREMGLLNLIQPNNES